MPLVEVFTNVSGDAAPKDFIENMAKAVGDALGKPTDRVSVAFMPGVQMYRGGTEPTATVHIGSFGVFNPEKNPGYAKAITEFISKKLNIEPLRVIMAFHDTPAEYVCLNGTTAAVHLKGK